MDYGIKVSKRGFNVLNLDQNRIVSSKKSIVPHLLYGLALPYLNGANKQVVRYQLATQLLKQSTIKGVYECLHEASTLFEDLSTVSKYVEMCGEKNSLHQLWLDVRNHIRHDFREEFDIESSKRKNDRGKRLKLDSRLQTNIGFNIKEIKIGGTIITISQINNYLKWAEDIILKVLNVAKAKGDFKQE